VWVVTETGIALFSRVFNQDHDQQLFAGVLSALNSFSEQISEGGLSSFQVSEIRFSMIKRKGLIFVASSNPRAKKKKALDELNIIAEKFLNKYSKILEDWNSDISQFADFSQVIADSLEIALQNLKHALW